MKKIFEKTKKIVISMLWAIFFLPQKVFGFEQTFPVHDESLYGVSIPKRKMILIVLYYFSIPIVLFIGWLVFLIKSKKSKKIKMIVSIVIFILIFILSRYILNEFF